MKRLALIVGLSLLFVSLGNAQAATGFTKVGNVSTLAYTDATCPNQSTCYYQVTAVDANGFESGPAACAGSPQLCVGGNEAVAVMPSSGTHTVSLGWTASTSTGVTYNVYRHFRPLPASNLAATVN